MMRFVAGLAATALFVTAAGSSHAAYSVTDIVGAAKKGDYHAVHRLIEDGPEVLTATDGAGYTALHWAGVRGHWPIFAELVAAGADPNAVGGDGGTPLHWACHHDNAEAVEMILDAGADPAVANRWGRTPLHVAARRGCTSVAALLIERGADPNAQTKEGWTPLHVAMMSDQPEVIVVLIEGGADPAARDGQGLTPAAVARTRPAAVAVDPAILDDYVGIYDLGGGFTTKVWREGDGLAIREFAPDGLYPIGADAFFCESEPWRVEFNRADDGEVEGIVLHFLRRSVAGARTPSPQYVGASACADCHSELAKGNPHVVWMSSRHGHAYWRLAADWALFLGRLRPQYADLEDPITDDRCLLCHVTGRQDDNALFSASFRADEGIGCESCHGPGSLYVDPEIMGDRDAFLAAGGRVPDEDTCRSCHRRSENFDYAEYWPKIAHGKAPPAETVEGH
ncbi:MAG: ankyrin repeat domain-containing protein [Candidatus Sulfomarinibacteraceae bacterium]